MPYAIRRTKHKKCFQVYNKNTKRIFAKCTTKQNAIKQSKLLRALMYNPDFVPNAQRTITTLKNPIRLKNKRLQQRNQRKTSRVRRMKRR